LSVCKVPPKDGFSVPQLGLTVRLVGRIRKPCLRRGEGPAFAAVRAIGRADDNDSLSGAARHGSGARGRDMPNSCRGAAAGEKNVRLTP